MQYPEAEWRALAAQLAADHAQLGAVDRAQLIDDAFSLLRAGQLPPAVPLELVAGYLARERSLVAWEVRKNIYGPKNIYCIQNRRWRWRSFPRWRSCSASPRRGRT